MAFPQVTASRIENILAQENLHFELNNEGDFLLGFDYFVIYIHLADNLLRVSAVWRTALSDEQKLLQATIAANQLNKLLAMPKTVIAGPGPFVIFETALPIGIGYSDKQLKTFIIDSFRCSFAAENMLANHMPEIAPARTKGER